MKWDERLKKAIKYDITDEEHTSMVVDSCSWKTCAIGECNEQLKKLGYNFTAETGEPTNDNIRKLGSNFYSAVIEWKFKEALEILKVIHKLAKEV